MNRSVTYSVVSNPIPNEHGDLYVLFSGESQTKPGHMVGPKVYDFYLMHHVLSGSGTFSYEGEQREVSAGQSFLIHPDQLISYASSESEPWRYRWIAFEGPQAAKLVSGAGLSAQQPIINTGLNPRVSVLYRSIERSFRHGGSTAHLRAAGYLYLLFAEFGMLLSKEEAGAPQRGNDGKALIQQVIRYLSTQYTEPISIENIAEMLGYNRAYLSRLFKQQTGLTPVTFLLKLRIDKAHLLLRERLELTIEQVAASVGFQDPLYFSKQFRRFYGQSPTVYRETMKTL
ncbi:AraC family transcriptional regulator [Paenibacillus baekrokdamisoli]|uniref:AraC family transcriptional regulator n=1 Tax=Paenibacillus baekrokdamisoli TaxID=1712516 RepID=A0A3G9IU82_9BACL|nr:AraC family transcriptional regulator [Paenibacillus baekrokdamisoli]MBB3071679.1 AraC-like DNA-binding protein [Paenibacillus baekrokdamisoli]BBH21812.1 AraC family transcriptional regulator [Paenibacillus baekrokdamisoli]